MTAVNAKERVAAGNVETRVELWHAAVIMTAEHPLLGVGPGNFSSEVASVTGQPLGEASFVAHDAYLEVAAEFGIAGLVAFLAFLGMQWSRLGRAVSRPETHPLAVAVRTSFVVALVGALTLSEQFFAPIWIAASLATVLDLAEWRRDRRPNMKVTYVSTLVQGGPVAHLEGLVPFVLAAGADVDVVVGTDALADRFEAIGARAHVIPVDDKRDLIGALRLWPAFGDTDIVHSQDRRAGLFARALGRAHGARVVHTVHGLPEDIAPGVGRVGDETDSTGHLASTALVARVCVSPSRSCSRNARPGRDAIPCDEAVSGRPGDAIRSRRGRAVVRPDPSTRIAGPPSPDHDRDGRQSRVVEGHRHPGARPRPR